MRLAAIVALAVTTSAAVLYSQASVRRRHRATRHDVHGLFETRGSIASRDFSCDAALA